MKKISNNYLKRKRIIELLNKTMQNKITYISAPIGCGKTIAVKQKESEMKCEFYWIDCNTKDEIVISKVPNQYIVLENFNDVQCKNKEYLIDYINKNKKNKFIIISRKQLDTEFDKLFCSGDLAEIDKDDLNFTKDEIEELLRLNSIKVSAVELSNIYSDIKGYAIITNLLTDYLKDAHYSKIIFDLLMQYLCRYIDYNIFQYFEKDKMNFLIKLAYINEIDENAINNIFKINNAKEMLEKIENEGSFLTKKCNNKYVLIDIAKIYLKQKAREKISKEEEKDIFLRAARYYENAGSSMIIASEYYILAEEYDTAAKLLMKEPIQHLGIINYEELERYILQIPDKIINKYPRLCISVANIYGSNSNQEKANFWYEKFKKIKENFVDDKEEYNKLNQLEVYYKICMPNTSDIKLIDYFKLLDKNIKGDSILNKITFTGNQPSMLSGGKDLSDWGKHYKIVYITLNPLVKKIFGENQYGSGEIALADYLYQINKIEESIEYLTKALVICKNIDNLFVAYNLLDKINLLKNEEKDTIESFGENIEDEKAWYLKPNYEARLIEKNILNGELEIAKQWLNNNKTDIIKNFNNLDRYKYFIMAKVCIADEKYLQALIILERLYQYAIENNKPIYKIEYHILKSICFYKQDKKIKSFNEIEEAIKISYPYGYIRLFADEGIIIFKILKDYQNYLYADKKVIKTKYYEDIMNEARKYGQMYPYKYINKDKKMESLTNKEIEILELIKQGKTNNEICADLSISIATVKTHINHVYSKLGTKNRVQTINKMKEL